MSDKIELDWPSIIGGGGKSEWIDHQAMKVELGLSAVERLRRAGRGLSKVKAHCRCNAEALLTVPGAVGWYLGLMSFSQKQLRTGGFDGLQLSGSANVFVSASENDPGSLNADDCDLFCSWVNEMLDVLHIPKEMTVAAAVGLVCMTAGAMIVGQAQNKKQTIPHVIVRRALLGLFDRAEWEFKEGRNWLPIADGEHRAHLSNLLRHRPTGAEFDFTLGPGRPDLSIKRQESFCLVSELKGRMDASNLWESWMPQALSHMREWGQHYPRAIRAIMMTSIPKNAVDGDGGTKEGLKSAYESGRLNSVVNLTKLDAGDPHATETFRRTIGLALR